MRYSVDYVYFRLHKIWPSIRLLSKSLSINVNNAEAHKVLGMDFTIVNRLDLAAKELVSAVELNPKSAESHYALGRVYYEQGAYGRAVTNLQKAIALDPGYVKAYHNLGLAYEATTQISWQRRLWCAGTGPNRTARRTGEGFFRQGDRAQRRATPSFRMALYQLWGLP